MSTHYSYIVKNNLLLMNGKFRNLLREAPCVLILYCCSLYNLMSLGKVVVCRNKNKARYAVVYSYILYCVSLTHS